MNKFFSMLCAVTFAMFAMSCGKADAGKVGENVKNEKSEEIAFFKAQGIDTKKIPLGATLKLEGDYAGITIDSLQQKTLLKDVSYLDDDTEYAPPVWLLGVKTLNKGFVLAAYMIEAGDCNSVFFVTYDKSGKLLDVIDTRSWVSIEESYVDERGMRHVNGDRDNAFLTMKGDTMTLHRSLRRSDLPTDKVLWEQKRDYEISIDDDGVFVIDGVKKSGTTVNCPAGEASDIDVYYDVMDFHYHSQVGKNLFADLEKYLTSGKVATPDSREAAYNLFYNFLYVRPKLMFDYMYAHKNSVVWKWLENSVLEDQVPKSLLYEAIQALPAGAEKDYLNEATAQWSAAGSVG